MRGLGLSGKSNTPQASLKRDIAPSLRARSVYVRTMYMCEKAEYIQRTKRGYIRCWFDVDTGRFLRLVEDALPFDTTVMLVLGSFDSRADHITPFDAPLALYMSPSPSAHILGLGLGVWAASTLLRAIEDLARQGTEES